MTNPDLHSGILMDNNRSLDIAFRPPGAPKKRLRMNIFSKNKKDRVEKPQQMTIEGYLKAELFEKENRKMSSIYGKRSKDAAKRKLQHEMCIIRFRICCQNKGGDPGVSQLAFLN